MLASASHVLFHYSFIYLFKVNGMCHCLIFLSLLWFATFLNVPLLLQVSFEPDGILFVWTVGLLLRLSHAVPFSRPLVCLSPSPSYKYTSFVLSVPGKPHNGVK